jgi:hypothetical protein
MGTLRERWRRVGLLDRDVGVGCAVFTVLRLWAVVGTTPIRFPDSASYAYVNLFGHATGGRLWTVPAFYAVIQDDHHRVVAQAVVGSVCWGALAFAVAHSLVNGALARIGAGAILLLGLCVQVTQWDQTILSESVSLSLGALLVATILWLRLRRSWSTIAAVLVVVALWIFARQLQVLLFIPVAVALIAWIVLRARRYVVVAVALTALGVWSGYATSQDKMHLEYDAHDIVEFRILQVPGGSNFIARTGMPDFALMKAEAARFAATGAYVGGTNSKVYLDPAWRRWVDKHFKRTFVDWVVHHPWWTIRLPLLDIPTALDGNPHYGAPRTTLPSPVQDLFWERTTGSFPFWAAISALIWTASLFRGRPGSLEWLAIGGIGISILWYYAAWHLSGSEVPRLSVPVAAFFRVSLLLLALGALDRMVAVGRDATDRRANAS